MTNNNISHLQEGKTFLNLIQDKKIIIPKIQRDYAQGRLDKKTSEIRDGFTSSIIDTLKSSKSKPLLLDFIYGSMEESIFIPLDGQQRLTTLFLLHWYLIPKDESFLLQIESNNTISSRFSYETRISSKDFCNSLVLKSIIDLKSKLQKENEKIDKEILDIEKKQDAKNQICLSNTIKNQSWFLWEWRKDPSIKGILVMLDELDRKLRNQSEDSLKIMWNYLKEGKIVFHLLPLEKFALTNELYIKMNARGKELSSFDIFKSTLEEQMRLNKVDENIQNNWRNNIDSNWIDLFWDKLAKSTIDENAEIEKQQICVDSVEEGYLRFLKRMMEFYLFINDTCFECDWSDENIKSSVAFDIETSVKPTEVEIKTILSNIREYLFNERKYNKVDILDLMPLFNKTKFFSQDFFEFVINSFNSFIYIFDKHKYEGSDLIEGIYFTNKQQSLFKSFIDENIDYEKRVQFFAVLQFFKFNNAEKIKNDRILNAEFNSWMRIIRNLSTNTNNYFYNGYDDFLKSLKAIEKMASDIYSNGAYDSIVHYFTKQKDIDGFDGKQIIEEKTKAILFSDENWRNAILDAEEHPYFSGQIRFLLEWSKEDGNYNLEKFAEYFDKICCVFNANGLKSELIGHHVFRNALMTISDWYLFKDSFIQNEDKSREDSWKRYLREEEKSINIKVLLDKWDKKSEFYVFCENLIKSQKLTDWRKYFIERPEIYNVLKDSKISPWNIENGEVRLLSKTRKSSIHKELRTYYFYLTFKSDKDGKDEYIDSRDDINSFSAVFNISNKNEISIQYIEGSENGESQNGYYIVCTSENIELDGAEFNDKSKKYEKYFHSNFEELEKLLDKIILKTHILS